MSYDEILEQPYYYDSDNYNLPLRKSSFPSATKIKHQNKAKSINPPSQYISNVNKIKIKKYTVPWISMDAYIKQCKLSEERNMKDD